MWTWGLHSLDPEPRSLCYWATSAFISYPAKPSWKWGLFFFKGMVTIQGKPKLNLDYKVLAQRWAKYTKKHHQESNCAVVPFAFFFCCEMIQMSFLFLCLSDGCWHGRLWLEIKWGWFCVPQCPRLPAGGWQRRFQAVLWSSLLGMLIHPGWLSPPAQGWGHSWAALQQTRVFSSSS